MNRTTIRKALSRAAGGAEFVTQGDIKRCIGCGNDRAAEITRGLDFIRFNRTKQYDIGEVADRIYENTVRR
jgi:hypothetical protein